MTEGVARCINCGPLSVDKFYYCRRDGRSYSYCKNCDKERQRQWRKGERGWKLRLLRAARDRARSKDLPFAITIDDFNIPEYCPVLGLELITGWDGPGVRGIRPNAASIDRIYPEKGYVQGNIQVISFLANRMKGEASPDQLRRFATWIITTFPEES